MWLFVPVQQKVKEFLTTIPDYPFQEGSSLNAGGINYQTLKAADAMKRLQELETILGPGGPIAERPTLGDDVCYWHIATFAASH